MFRATITNEGFLGSPWSGVFDTEEEANDWLELQKLLEGRLPERDELDEEGNVIGTLPAQAEYLVEDVTAEIDQLELNKESIQYLNETDWYVIRFLESGVAVPEEVTTQRAAARAAVVR